MRWKAVIFDRDGTLFDSLGMILRAFNYGIEPYTDYRPTDAEWFASFGPAEPAVLATFVGEQHKIAAFERFYTFYRDHFHEVPLFPGIRETLQRLHDAGVGMAIFTGGGLESTIFCLREQKILSFFQELITGDRVQHPKPHPEGVLRAMNALGARPDETLVVGDAVADVLAGRSAGACTALVRWSRPMALQEILCRPDFVVQEIAELQQLLFEEPKP